MTETIEKGIKLPLCVRCGHGHSLCTCIKYEVPYITVDALTPGSIVQVHHDSPIFDTTMETSERCTIMLSTGMIREAIECDGMYFITLYGGLLIAANVGDFPYKMLWGQIQGTTFLRLNQ